MGGPGFKDSPSQTPCARGHRRRCPLPPEGGPMGLGAGTERGSASAPIRCGELGAPARGHRHANHASLSGDALLRPGAACPGEADTRQQSLCPSPGDRFAAGSILPGGRSRSRLTRSTSSATFCMLAGACKRDPMPPCPHCPSLCSALRGTSIGKSPADRDGGDRLGSETAFPQASRSLVRPAGRRLSRGPRRGIGWKSGGEVGSSVDSTCSAGIDGASVLIGPAV